MNRRSILAAVLAFGLIGTASATRVLEQPEGAYEVALADVVLPGSTAGYVIFKPCAGCESMSMSVTAATRYTVEGTAVPFADFLAAAQEYRQLGGRREQTQVCVFYDVDSKQVNRLSLERFGN